MVRFFFGRLVLGVVGSLLLVSLLSVAPVFAGGVWWRLTSGRGRRAWSRVVRVRSGTFELNLSQGPYSALAAKGKLCTANSRCLPNSSRKTV